uniref:Antimicrobial peptide n=1 Tax=Ascaris lumbricoides TaxID=6252 RepID=A0A0M3IIS0_ASCLU
MLANVGAIVLALIIISVTGHEDCFPMKKWKVDQAITRALRKAADGYGVGSILGAIYDEVQGFQEQYEETEAIAAYR